MSRRHPWEASSDFHLREWPEVQLKQAAPSAFTDIISAFFRNKQQIVVALLLFIVAVTAFLLFSPTTYLSRAIYLVRSEGATFPITTFDDRGTIPQIASQMEADIQIGTEAELLSGTDLHREVLKSLHSNLTPTEIDRQLIGFERHLKVFPIPKTTLISVSYVGTSRDGANATLQALGKEYLRSKAQIRATKKAYDFFASEADRYHEQLETDQTSLAAFEQANQVALLDEEKSLVTRRLSDAHAFLNDNDAAVAEASHKLVKMSSEHDLLPARLQTQTRTLPDQLGTEHLRSLLVDLQNKQLELLNKYQASDRHLQDIDKQIANTQRALDSAQTTTSTEEQSDVNPVFISVDTDLEHTKIQVAGLEGRRRSLRSQIGTYDAKLQHLNQITEQHDDLERRIKQDAENLDLYSKRREQAKTDEALDGSKIANISLVSGPTIVPQPFSQKILGIASLYTIGCIVILGIGILSGLWSSTFQAPWEIETVVGPPVLATVPSRFAIRGAISSHPGVETLATQGRTIGLPEVQTQTPVSAHIASLATISRGLYGAYFSLVERLRKISPSRPGALVIALTASTSGEGVSHVARGLADELQNVTGKRIAVISAPEEYRASSLYVNTISGETGANYKESAEEFLRSWFRKLREASDYVLIDCPSMDSSHVAIALGRESDGVLLVVGAGDATRMQVSGSILALSLASVPIVGIALNKRTYPIPPFLYKRL